MSDAQAVILQTPTQASAATVATHFPANTQHAVGSEPSLEVQLGLLLFGYKDKFLRKGSVSATKFRSGAVEETKMYPRLTTSTSDAKYLLGLVDGTTQTQSLYEFHVRDSAGLAKVIVCGSDAGLVSSWTKDRQTISKACVHYPFHIWDAQYSVKLTPTDGVLKNANQDLTGAGSPSAWTEAIEQLLASMTTAGDAPSFYAKVPNTAFNVEKVLAKREYARTTEGATIVVTEVQDLSLSSLNETMANIKATCSERAAMIADQRLWWEAKIVAKDADDVEDLHRLAERMVKAMDGVGYGNRGPWESRPDTGSDDGTPHVPFW